MGVNTSGNFWEFLGIPNNSKFEVNCLWNLWVGVLSNVLYYHELYHTCSPCITIGIISWGNVLQFQGCHYKDFKLLGKYNKQVGNQTARDFFWFYFSSISI